MSINTISSLPKGVNSVASQPNNVATEIPLGDFATLLSGELLNLNGLTPALSTKTLAMEMIDKEPALATEDLSTDTTNLLDPSILAALNGNSTLQPEITTRGNFGLPAEAEKLEKGISKLNASTIGLDMKSTDSEQRDVKTPVLESLRVTLAQARQGGSIGPDGETANFAADAKNSDLTPPALINSTGNNLINSLGNNPAVKSATESISTEPSNISTHLRDNLWSQQFGEKIVWLSKNGQQSAQININPPELGPVQITLNLSGDQAKMVFASPHAEVRQAIENALPQLREMLSATGISLGQTNVGANMAQQNPDNPYQAGNGKRLTDENAILPANDKALSVGASSVLQRGRGMVDLFA